MGGGDECSHVFKAKDFEDFRAQAESHFEKEHAELLKDVTEVERSQWVSMVKTLFEALP